ncbi:protein of unknown function [Candidatus Methylocalor cossyra]|uniref:Uncharacterized protein n=1 Tax=Candidatus Methylocalor cossyra TaxID=3108543 RepID=A0ABM9NMB8_9GAMM
MSQLCRKLVLHGRQGGEAGHFRPRRAQPEKGVVRCRRPSRGVLPGPNPTLPSRFPARTSEAPFACAARPIPAGGFPACPR